MIEALGASLIRCRTDRSEARASCTTTSVSSSGLSPSMIGGRIRAASTVPASRPAAGSVVTSTRRSCARGWARVKASRIGPVSSANPLDMIPTVNGRAVLDGAGAAHGELGLGHPLEDVAGARQQLLAGVGEADGPGRALEQDGADLVLEAPDHLREGRGRHAQPQRGAAEVQLLRDGDERPQLGHRGLAHVPRPEDSTAPMVSIPPLRCFGPGVSTPGGSARNDDSAETGAVARGAPPSGPLRLGDGAQARGHHRGGQHRSGPRSPTPGSRAGTRRAGPPGCRPPPVLALFTAATTASTSAPPNWNEVLTSPPASPCSSGAMPLVAAMLSGPKARAKPRPAEQHGRQHRGQVARVDADRQEEHVAADGREQAER